MAKSGRKKNDEKAMKALIYDKSFILDDTTLQECIDMMDRLMKLREGRRLLSHDDNFLEKKECDLIIRFI